MQWNVILILSPKPILESLTLEMRFEKPSEIQASTLPIIIGGHNLIAQAQSGAGKTIAFVIGMLSKVDPRIPELQALCLTPTRELANQILSDAVRPLSTRIPGISYEEALPGREVAHGSVCRSHLMVGTPGTVLRWMSSGYVRLDRLRIFTLDEADHMVADTSMGKSTMDVRRKLPAETQILLFSATYTPDVIAFARKIVPRAYLVTPRSTEELVLDVIFQVRMDVNKCAGGKLQVLKDIYDFLTLQQSIVFVEMKVEADKVAQMMTAAGFEVSTLHGELQPDQRDRVMNDFRSGRTKVLITTNVLARGVDVPAVAVVVNYDLPTRRMGNKLIADEATYLHRIGRCGRFGRRGTAISFLEKPQDFAILDAIEQYFSPGKRMTTEWDPNNIEGLSDTILSRPAGGEILPEAMAGSQQIRIAEFR
jgi:ATP-dependent RNA helicase DDX19/DBP5